jgi:hypothetical protein
MILPSARKATGESTKPTEILCEPALTSNSGVWSQGCLFKASKNLNLEEYSI